MKRPIAVDTITRQHASWVLGMAGIEPGEEPREDTLPHYVIHAAFVATDEDLQRLERAYEGLVSAARLFREGQTGLNILKSLAAAASPF